MTDILHLERGMRTRVIRPGERRSVSRSATRALDLLELFGRLQRPLRAVDIARALGLPSSTADQLLKSMVEAAHLTFDASGKSYLPSPRLAHFGGWIAETYGADERLRRLLRGLRTATGAIATLTTPHGLFMQIIDLAARPDEIAERGLRVSMFGTAIGTAYLSSLDAKAFDDIAYDARVTANDLAIVREQIAALRETGCADGPTEDGSFWSIAALLDDDALPRPLVLGLAGPAKQLRKDLPRLRMVLISAIDRWRSQRRAYPR